MQKSKSGQEKKKHGSFLLKTTVLIMKSSIDRRLYICLHLSNRNLLNYCKLDLIYILSTIQIRCF